MFLLKLCKNMYIRIREVEFILYLSNKLFVLKAKRQIQVRQSAERKREENTITNCSKKNKETSNQTLRI